MTKFDRYMLSQFMVLFGFFALVLVSIFWINKAVRMFDRLIGDGQTAWIFLEFTALTLPAVIGVVLPIAAFAASVYVTNRLSTESELTVMQATGYSPWRLIRPALIFGLIVGAMMSLLTHLLIPSSQSQLNLRQVEISRNVTAKLLTEGEFLHPSPGVTFYIREITPEGELRDVFMSDRRSRESPVTYTSKRAYLVQEGGGTRLVMLDGLSQNVLRDGNRLFTTHFGDFSYDISRMLVGSRFNLDTVAYAHTHDLIANPDAVAERTGASDGEITFELHNRFAQALMCVMASVIGFATLMIGAYSRFGVWRQIVVAFFLLVGVKLIEGAVSGSVLGNAMLWPMMYLPAMIGAFLTVGMLYTSANPSLWRLWRTRKSQAPKPEGAA